MTELTHTYEPGLTYLLTFITHRRQSIFAEETYARIAHEDIAFYAAKFKALSLAHVIMPDHIHWVMRPSPDDFDRFAHAEKMNQGKYRHAPEKHYLTKILEDYKRHVSYAVNKQAGTTGLKHWQEGFQDKGLRSTLAVRQAVEYVLFNPIKAGLVAQPEDYPFLAWDGGWLG